MYSCNKKIDRNIFTIEIISSEELGGFPMTGKNDIGLLKIYDENENVINEYWMTLLEDGMAKLEKI